jgi:hypothetical protein
VTVVLLVTLVCLTLVKDILFSMLLVPATRQELFGKEKDYSENQ